MPNTLIKKSAMFVILILSILKSNNIIADIETTGHHSPEMACDYFEQLASSNDGYGYQSLAHCYRTGVGRTKNLRQAENLFLKSIEQNYIPAYSDLAAFYLFELGDESYYSNALRLLDIPIKTGHSKAIFILATALKNGLGIDKDSQKSQDLYDIAANKGHQISVFMKLSGYCYGALESELNVDKCTEWKKYFFQVSHIRNDNNYYKLISRIVNSKLLRDHVFTLRDIELIKSKQ
ncbi:MAG: sel1 repeat family protein [Immundisolibacteraceae bacterium]|nr:sel1 repeat family protein [Immundisolibacteraceae bacterium]